METSESLLQRDIVKKENEYVGVRISRGYAVGKRLFDIVLSCIGLIVLFTIFLMIGFVVRLTSRGPVLFIQERIGLHGKKFRLYKFRTMVSDADNWRKYLTDKEIRHYQVKRKLDNDPRVTRVGKFLRKTSLDELPQLVNVFKGNMSLVGPRPMLPEEVLQYGNEYHRYITLRPGITGVWQIQSRHSTQMNERALKDREYYDHVSLTGDFQILFRTLNGLVLSSGI